MKNLLKLWLLGIVLALGIGEAFGQYVWTKDARNPILSGGASGTWNHHVLMPCVIYNADSLRYEMWFGASSGSPWEPYQIGFATSKDGITWSIYPTPVLSPTSGTWDGYTVEQPAVLRENGQYKMWYASYFNIPPSYPGSIGLATSPDGIHWTKYSGNPVLGPGTAAWESAGPYSCNVMPFPGGYRMWYAGYDLNTTETNIGYAFSSDGITWHRDTVHNPVLKRGASGQWDYPMILQPQVLRKDSTYYMWYSGFNGRSRYVGVATSKDTGKTWTKYSGNPVLSPSIGWDGSDVTPGTVLLRGDTLDMWYAGEESLWMIGHATSGSSSAAKRLCGPSFQAFVDRVEAAQYSQRSTIVDSFMTAPHGFPFVEDTIAQFIYRGPVTSVSVPGDHNGWVASLDPLLRLSSTDLWYVPHVFERDARIDYKFIVNGSTWIIDPLNPIRTAGGFGDNSTLEMPAYIPPWEIRKDTTIQHGRSEFLSIHSNIRGVTYNLQVYLPYGYDGSAATYPTAYFQDGSDYVNLGYAINVLDNSIGRSKIKPIIGVFVTPTNRNEEYAFTLRNQYRQFFVSELVPFIDSVYRTIRSADDRVVIGESYGGNISALISYNHPEVFGNCGLQSGAFGPNSNEAYDLIVAGPVKPIKYHSVWGTYSDVTYTMRLFRDSLIAKGYFFRWEERHEGHSWGQWCATIDTILQTFFPKTTGDIAQKQVMPTEFRLAQNYPNPFNPSTVISYQLPVVSNVKLAAYDILGREVAMLVNERKNAGSYEVKIDGSNLASGVYFYRLQAGDFVQTRRLLLLK